MQLTRRSGSLIIVINYVLMVLIWGSFPVAAKICSCVSFFLTFWLIRRIGAIRTAYSDFIIPGVTLILSYLFVGESLTTAKVIGLALVILGVILVQIP